MTSSSCPGKRNFTARKLLVIWRNTPGQIFSEFVRLPEAGPAQLKPLPGWVPAICSVLESSLRDCTCFTNLRQPRSFIQQGVLSTCGLCESAFNSKTKSKTYTPFNPEISFLWTYSAKKKKNLPRNMHWIMFLETHFLMVIKNWPTN